MSLPLVLPSRVRILAWGLSTDWSEGRQIALWILYTLINFCKLLLHVGQSRLSDVSTVRKKIRKKNWTILFDLTHYDCFLKKILKNFFQSQWQCTQWKVYLSSNFNRCPGRFCEGMGPTLRKDESCQTVQLYNVHACKTAVWEYHYCKVYSSTQGAGELCIHSLKELFLGINLLFMKF